MLIIIYVASLYVTCYYVEKYTNKIKQTSIECLVKLNYLRFALMLDWGLTIITVGLYVGL